MAPFERNLPRFPPSFAKPLKGIPQIYTAKRKCEDAWLPIMAKWEETQSGWGGNQGGVTEGSPRGKTAKTRRRQIAKISDNLSVASDHTNQSLTIQEKQIKILRASILMGINYETDMKSWKPKNDTNNKIYLILQAPSFVYM